MAANTQYDAIIVGSGQAGVPLSTALANAGWKTAIIERIHVGGTCINEGCTPTKTMVASARVAYLTRRGAGYGVKTGELRIELAKVRERKRAIVDSFRSGGQKRLENTAGLEVMFGTAEFTAARKVRVRKADGTEATLTADRVFINAGCRPAVPALE